MRGTREGADPDPKPKSGTVAGVQAEAKPHCAATRSGLDAGDGARATIQERGQVRMFDEVLAQALAVKALEWSPGSRARFEGVAANYLSRWASWEVEAITRAAVLAWLGEMQQIGTAPATQVKALAVFRATWAEARRCDVTNRRDPSTGMPVKKPPHRMGRALNELELTRLVRAATESQIRAQVLTASVMGLRWGEIAGLNVGDVDLSVGLLHVRSSLARGQHGYVLKSPKTTSSLRAVPVPEAMTSLFRLVTVGRTGPLFVTDAVARLNYHSSRRALIRLAAEADVPDCTGWHVLRRTAATLALQGGLTLKDVQALLGHATPSQTLAAYVAARDMLTLSRPLNGLATAAMGQVRAT